MTPIPDSSSRFFRLLALSAPIVLSLAGGLAYLRNEWDPPKAVFFLLVAFGATLVGAAVVRLWMGESALLELRLSMVSPLEMPLARREQLADIFRHECRDVGATIAGSWTFVLVDADGTAVVLRSTDPADEPVVLHLQDRDIERMLRETNLGEHRFEIRDDNYRFVAVTEAPLSVVDRTRLQRLVLRSTLLRTSQRA